MVKVINKKAIKIILFVVIVISVISISNKCFALGDVTKDTMWSEWKPTLEPSGALDKKAEPILGAIRVIGILVSVGSLSFIGIKIMIGSVEDKSNYKQILAPWVLGAMMVFAITFIPGLIYELTTNTLEGNYTIEYSQDYLDGYDKAAEWAKTKSQTNIDNFKNAVKEKMQEKISENPSREAGYDRFLKELLDCTSPTNYIEGYKDMKKRIDGVHPSDEMITLENIVYERNLLLAQIKEIKRQMDSYGRGAINVDAQEEIKMMGKEKAELEGKYNRLQTQYTVWKEEGKIR